MRCLKIIFCVLMISFVAVSSGCKGSAVKGFIKSVGNNKTITRHADDIAEVAIDMASSNTPSNNPRLSAPIRGGKASTVTRAGAVMAGGAIAANEFLNGALTAKDLSLGTITMDDRAEKVAEELGRPISTSTDSDGGKRMTFKDVEVVVYNGKVSALVSQSSALATARGIHEGSSAQEVFDRYGTDYVKTSYDSQTLYEYKITSADGHSCWLRFAVNNSSGKVDYISERLFQR